MKKRILSLVLLCAILISSTVSVSAAAPSEGALEPKASFFITDYLGYVTDQGNGVIRIVCDVTAKYSVDTLGVSHIEIQRHDPATNSWIYVGTIYGNSYNNLLRSNCGSVLQGVNFDDLIIGRTYRAVIRFYAKNGSMEEARVYTTGGVTLQ